MIKITSRGDFKKTTDFLDRLKRREIYRDLNKYGRLGVEALSRATPRETGLTANSWHYRVFMGRRPGIEWYNTNMTDVSVPVAILIQYGHGTGTGGYVAGRDFINPAMRPIFQQIADDVWKKVRA
jgi:hypothetical protein